MTYDVIVAGIGGMGSAALRHLAARNVRVLGIERFDIPHELGSSHGQSRIIRLAYAEHPSYVPLLRRAYSLWRELAARTGEKLLVVTGGIDAGPPDGSMLRGSLESCRIHDIPHEMLDSASIARRFPGYCLAPDMAGVYQADAGFLLPERCILAHVRTAQKLGAEIHTRERVMHWNASDSGIAVETDRGTYRARKLVLTLGPWARSLIPQLQELAVPERQVMIWTEPLVPRYFQPDVFPIFVLEAPEGRFYGFPSAEHAGFKIGKYNHRRERIPDPDHMNRVCRPEDEAVLREGIRRYFPDANGRTLAMKPCMFTNSPDEHFIIDLLPHCRDVAIAAGFSGHGFKFCSVVGEIMADLLMNGGTSHDIGLFRLHRFIST